MKRVSRLTILAEVEAEEAASANLEVSPSTDHPTMRERVHRNRKRRG